MYLRQDPTQEFRGAVWCLSIHVSRIVAVLVSRVRCAVVRREREREREEHAAICDDGRTARCIVRERR